MNRQEKKESKYKAFHALLKGLAETYENADEAAKQFLETTVGAALFYLPSSKALHYSGFITQEALDSGNETQEHMFPRKIAAEGLLTDVPETPEELMRQCDAIYLRFHIVTPKQNKDLCPHQKRDVFTTPDAAYEKAGIELIPDPRLQN